MMGSAGCSQQKRGRRKQAEKEGGCEQSWRGLEGRRRDQGRTCFPGPTRSMGQDQGNISKGCVHPALALPSLWLCLRHHRYP